MRLPSQTSSVLVVAALSLSASFAAPPEATARQSQTAAPVCTRLATAIRDRQYEISLNHAANIAESSAPRATMRSAEMTAQLEEVHVNIQLLAAHRCPAYPEPIRVDAYDFDALHCHVAMLSAQVSGPAALRLPECDRSKWTRRN